VGGGMARERGARASQSFVNTARSLSGRGARAQARERDRQGLSPKKVKEHLRAQVVGAIRGGASWRKAAQIGKCTQATARAWWQRWTKTGSFEDMPRSGRPRKWQPPQLEVLKEVRALTPGWESLMGFLRCYAGRR
jgi:hypothetical protein